MNNMKTTTIAILLIFVSAITQGKAIDGTVSDSLGFDKMIAQTPAMLLQGRISGIRVSATDGSINGPINTNIRGINTLRGDSQPLWIIDGTVVNASLNENNSAFWQYGEMCFTSPLNALSLINVNDIESIEVLKNISGTSIYGSKGANGVIIVKTRHPEQKGFAVNLSSNIALNTPYVTADGTRTSVSHNHYLSLMDVRKKTSLLISGFFKQNIATTKNSDNLSGGFRANFDVRANSVFSMGLNASVAVGKMNSTTGTSYFGRPSMTLNMLSPDSFYDSVDDWLSDYDDLAKEQRAGGSIYLALDFTPELRLKGTFGVDYQSVDRNIWYGSKTDFGFKKNGAASIMGTSVFNYNADAVFSWNKCFSGNHKLTLKAGVEMSGIWTKYNTSNGVDFFSHFLRANGLSLASSKPQHHKFTHEYYTMGFYGSADYSLFGILNLDALVRFDRTARYDDSRFTPYKAFNAAFDIHKLAFSDFTAVSSLSLIAGYGEAGKEKYVPYGLYGDYLYSGYPEIPQSLEMYYEAANRLKSKEYNVGVDLGFVSDRIKLKAVYYDKTTEDTFTSWCFGKKGQQYWDKAPRQDDFSVSSTIANRGFEFDLNATCLDNKSVTWTVFANASYNINQLLKVDDKDSNGKAVGNNLRVNTNSAGYPVGSLVGYTTNESGEIVDYIPDNKINWIDKTIIGNPIPKVLGALGTTLTIRNWTVDAIANGAAGFSVLNLGRLLKEGGSSSEITDKYVEKGDYIRLGRLSVNYSNDLKSVKWIKKLSVSLSALNLFTLSSYRGWNPDSNCFSTTSSSAGIDYGSFPSTRSFVLGLNITF